MPMPEEPKLYHGMWFMQNSFTADYGSFECDRCGRTFNHSPSTIYVERSPVERFHCCCGFCTNVLMYKDHGIEPYK